MCSISRPITPSSASSDTGLEAHEPIRPSPPLHNGLPVGVQESMAETAKRPTPSSRGDVEDGTNETTLNPTRDESEKASLAMAALCIFLDQLDAYLLSFTRDFFGAEFGKPVSPHARPVYIFSTLALFLAAIAAVFWTLMYNISRLRTHVISRATAVTLVVLSLSFTAAEAMHITIIILLRHEAYINIGYILPGVFIGVLLAALLLVFGFYCGWNVGVFLAVCCGAGKPQDEGHGLSNRKLNVNPKFQEEAPMKSGLQLGLTV